MIHRRLAGLAALVLLATLGAAPPATTEAACPPPSDKLLFHSCWGQGRVAVVLLPEDLPLPAAEAEGLRLVVTGAYTARDSRRGGLPKPVGLFVHGGAVINPNLGRMDGVLLVDPATGEPELHHRERLALGERGYDLTALDQRRALLAEVSARGLSVLQSHLLIFDGRIDAHPLEDAPVFIRRMLFVDEAGFGLYQTRWPKSLHEAARQLVQALAPRMALNLDMGSYDYCQRAQAGAEVSCGRLDRDDTGKLSNLLVLSLE
ncbi:MAG: hypothetical protein ACTSVG_13055 [Alphaproteobacteria bacterium]